MTLPQRWTFVRAIWRHGGLLGLACLQIVLLAAVQLLMPWPLKIVIDSVADTPPAWLHAWTTDASVAVATAALALIVLQSGRSALTLWHTRTQLHLGRSMVTQLRVDTYARYLAMPLRAQAQRRSGDLLHRLLTDTAQAWDLVSYGLFPILHAALFVLGMTAVMLTLDLRLTLVALTVAPGLFGLTRLMSRRIERETRRARTSEGHLFAQVQETLSQLQAITAFGLETTELARFAATNERCLSEMTRVVARQMRHGASADLLVAAGTAAVLLLGARRLQMGALGLGDLILFVGYLALLYQPMSALSQAMGRVATAGAALARVAEATTTVSPRGDGCRMVEPARVRGALRIEKVRFSYSPDRAVLHDLDLELRPGECVGLVGASGAGKSTLMALLLRLDDPDAGRILLDGTDLHVYSLASLRRCFAVLPQPPPIFAGSIRFNVTAGDPTINDERTLRALHQAGLSPLLSRLPAGLSSAVDEHGHNLSEGERQRLALARVLARDAPIVLLDEPTSALDALTESRILEHLRTSLAGRTVLLAAHRLSSLRLVDRILVLAHGQVVEEGTFDQLLVADGPFAALHRAQEMAPSPVRTCP